MTNVLAKTQTLRYVGYVDAMVDVSFLTREGQRKLGKFQEGRANGNDHAKRERILLHLHREQEACVSQ